MKSSCHPFQIQIFHAYCIEALSKTGTEFMLKVFSLISDLFMAQCNSFLLLLIILTAFLTSGQLSLFPCKLFLCIPVEHRISGSFTGRKYTHPMHGKIHPQEFFRLSFLRCLVFTVEQQAGKIFSGRFPAHSHWFQLPSLRDHTVEFYFYRLHLWQFQEPVLQTDIPIYHIRCIGFPRMFFWFIMRKSHSRFPEKFPESPFQI